MLTDFFQFQLHQAATELEQYAKQLGILGKLGITFGFRNVILCAPCLISFGRELINGSVVLCNIV
jgi:hypothetical protein